MLDEKCQILFLECFVSMMFSLMNDVRDDFREEVNVLAIFGSIVAHATMLFGYNCAVG